ncbi:MAG: arylesterase, partial [Alphaproteobacteria bacterium]
VKIKTLSRSLALTLILSVCSYTSIVEAEAKKLLVFGDSLVAGYGLKAGKGFTDQLQNTLNAKGLNVDVVNAGISGDTTNGGVERLAWALFDQPDAVILELGANDALRGLPLADTESNLRTLLNELQSQSIPVLFVGMKASPSLGKEYQKQFDSIFPKLASEFGVLFYPFFLEGVAANLNLNQEDGIHPNPEGVAKIINLMTPSILELLQD